MILKIKDTNMVKKFLLLIINSLTDKPLSVLRMLLALIVGLDVYKTIVNLIINVPNNKTYELSTTWIMNIFPERILDFRLEDFIYWKVLLIVVTLGAVIGLAGRFCLLILATITCVFYGADEGLGSFDHQLSFSAQVLFILALVPGSMGFSCDGLMNHFFLKQKKMIVLNYQPIQWGVNLLLLLLITTYFTAGISKLRFGGLDYLDGKTIGFYIQEHTFEYPNGDHKIIIGDSNVKEENKWKDKYGLQAYAYSNIQTSKKIRKIQYWVSNKPNLLKLITIGSIVFELIGFTVFFGSKYRNIYLFCAIMFHTTIGVLMGFTFYQYRIVCLCLIDWRDLYERCNVIW